jgi:hypothetical protein
MNAITIDPANIDRVYKGKINKCMCGCSGEYAYPEATDFYKANPKRVKYVLGKVLRGSAEQEGNCVFVETDTMIYAVYLKQ